MIEYLVESHMGGYYTTSMDPEFITEACEDCGDRDWILTSWDDEDENYMLEELKDLIRSKYTLNKQKIFEEIKLDYESGEDSLYQVINDLLEVCEFRKEENRIFIKDLKECSIITQKEHHILTYVNTRCCNMNKKLIKGTDTTTLKQNPGISRKRKNK